MPVSDSDKLVPGRNYRRDDGKGEYVIEGFARSNFDGLPDGTVLVLYSEPSPRLKDNFPWAKPEEEFRRKFSQVDHYCDCGACTSCVPSWHGQMGEQEDA